MALKDLSIRELKELLLENLFPEEIVETIAENYIDGNGLIELVDDFQELQLLIPQAGLRMKLKKLVVEKNSEMIEADGLIFSSMNLINNMENEIDFTDQEYVSTDSPSPLISLPSSPPLPNSIAIPDMSSNILSTPSCKRSLTSDEETPPSKKLRELRLPTPCPVPKAFSSVVEDSIQNGSIHGTVKLKMLRECAFFWHGVCPHPTVSEYSTMAKTICDKYPQLQDIDPRNGEYWCTVKDYLSQRFRNLRRCTQPLKGDKECKVSALLSMTAAVSMQKPDDDDTAYKRNKDGLIAEFKKRSSNHCIVQKLLKLTHKKRRELICSSNVHTTILLNEYPFFSSKIWIIAEFKLMTKEGILTTFKDNWLRLVPLALSSGDSTSIPTEEDQLNAIIQIDKSFRAGPSHKLPAAFKIFKSTTSVDDILLKYSPYSEPLLIIFTDEGDMLSQAFIIAEKTIIFEVTDVNVCQCLLSLLATYYVFDISYPKSQPASSFLLFLQEYLVELKVNMKKPAKYTAFINKLHQ